MNVTLDQVAFTFIALVFGSAVIYLIILAAAACRVWVPRLIDWIKEINNG